MRFLTSTALRQRRQNKEIKAKKNKVKERQVKEDEMKRQRSRVRTEEEINK